MIMPNLSQKDIEDAITYYNQMLIRERNVDADVCVWILKGEPFVDEFYETSCEHGFDYFVNEPRANWFVYCPYCGKKIQVRKK